MRLRIPIALSLLLPLACGATAPPPSPADGAPVEVRSEAGTSETASSSSDESSENSCADLTEKACLDSPACTLVPDSEAQQAYRCRQALPPCETGFRQSSDRAQECEAKEGCVFDPGQCYCAPDVVCICGGGPPPRCVAAGARESGDPES